MICVKEEDTSVTEERIVIWKAVLSLTNGRIEFLGLEQHKVFCYNKNFYKEYKSGVLCLSCMNCSIPEGLVI